MNYLPAFLVIGSLFAARLSSEAATISGLFNTGVDDSGVALADNAIDTHWTVTPEGGVAASPIVVTSAQGFPIGPWLADSADSAWISVSEDSNGDPVNYAFTIPFSLAGLDPGTVEITGRWATDNTGLDIAVNGTGTGQINEAQFAAWTDFSLSSGDGHAFAAGDNVLTFSLNNAPPDANPIGLRVEFLSATADVIPEPSSVALILVAALGLACRRRR